MEKEILEKLSQRIKDAEILKEIKDKIDFSSKSSIEKSLVQKIDGPVFRKLLIANGAKAISSISHEMGTSALTEAIILLHGRPALLIQDDKYETPESEIWTNRLEPYREKIINAIKATGRVELKNHTDYEWAGTGFLLESNFIITNRHVAVLFGEKNRSDKFVFKMNPAGKNIHAYIDFKEEYHCPEEAEYELDEILYIAEDRSDIPDVAILKINGVNDDPKPLPLQLGLSPDEPQYDQIVAVIGYPAEDGYRNDPKEMSRIFNNIYDIKRLQPGMVKASTSGNEFTHDCSTLGGNSGSPVIDVNTGKVLGLHFSGSYRKINYAVKSVYLQNLIRQIC
ncbi:MAG: serine protease [Ignavibacteriae bacterium]|nr:MAG: serine protease [Ignavibacteriota bacterium]